MCRQFNSHFLLVIALSVALSASGETAANLLSQAGIKGGLIVHVGSTDAKLTTSLRANASYQVQALTRDPVTLATLREGIGTAYGPVAADLLTTPHLPFIENLVNLLVVEDPQISRHEIDRVLVPNGVALIKAGNSWEKFVKPRPSEMDEWTHYAYDSKGNLTSKDTVVGPPKRMQWVGNPRWSRHHDRMSSVSAKVSSGGRLFYIMDEGSRISILMPAKFMLIARDAFNGTILWKKEIPEWSTHLWPLKSGPTQLTRRLVSIGDKVYVTLGITAAVTCLDAATGEVIREYPETKGTEEIIVRNSTLYALVNPNADRLNQEFAVKAQSDQSRVSTEFNWDGKPRQFYAIEADSGKVLWKKEDRIAPITLCLDDNRIVYYNGDGLTCLDTKTGAPKFADTPTKRRAIYEFNFAPRVLLHGDVILYAGGDGSEKALNADTGKEIWVAPHEKSGYRSPEDLIVAQGLVWNAGTTNGNQTGEYTGRDILTGEIKKQFYPDVPEGTYWFHHRCYQAKATEKYIMPSRTGIEYVDMEKQHWDLHHWVRGACLYGVLPANGLTYAGPHNCACYPEAKLDGLAVLASTPRYPMPPHTPDDQRLTQGPAYSQSINERESSPGDWPTYRGDNARSGHAKSDLRKDLSLAWEVQLTPPLSASISAGGLTYVSEVDKHTLHAITTTTGKTAWTFIAGGRIDSPPTYSKGRVFFGGKDGFVYCLRASDGALVWKFQASPSQLTHCAWEMMESVWPVHGSVLVENDLVSFVSGRSCFLDEGLWFYRLDAKTGEMKVKEHYDDRDPDTGGSLNDRHKTLQMPVASNDILSSDGKWTFLRTQKIGTDGKRVEIGPISGDFDKQGGAHKGEGQHLFAPMGFLDDSNFHRSYWVYGKSFAGGHGGYYQAGKYAPAGRVLVHDDKNVYSYGREAQYYKWTTTMEHTLYSTPKDAATEAFAHDDALTPRKGNSVVLDDQGKPLSLDLAAQADPHNQSKGKAKGAGKGGAKGATNGKGGASVAAAPTAIAPLPGSVRFPDNTSLDPTNKGFTLELWVLPDQPSGTLICYGGPQQGIALDLSDRKPRFHIRANSQLTTITAKDPIGDGWNHIAATVGEDKVMHIFVNGLQVAEGTASSLLTSKPKRPFYLGNGDGVAEGTSTPYSGLVDQFAYYTLALTPAEIEARFSSPDLSPEKAILFCNFDNGDSRDNSPTGAHGIGAGIESGKGKVGGAVWFKSQTIAKGGKAGKGEKSSGSFVKHTWDRFVPIVARSMALAGNTILVGGPPDMIDEEYAFERLAARDPAILEELKEQNAAIEGNRGAKMWAVNVETGEQSTGLDLTAPPVWDGIISANGQIFISTVDGKLQCFGK